MPKVIGSRFRVQRFKAPFSSRIAFWMRIHEKSVSFAKPNPIIGAKLTIIKGKGHS
jgi:hypothetical protein